MKPLAISITFAVIFGVESSFYWREYANGTIPDDAFPGGTDAAGQTTYIGQAYVNCLGLLVGPIHKGIKCINTCGFQGMRTTCGYIKILCSENAASLKWALHPNDTTSGSKFVIGGIEIRRPLYIARVKHQGELIIGRVRLSDNNDRRVIYCDYDCEKTSSDFEILQYV